MEALSDLVTKYGECKAAYYNSTQSYLSDSEFDALERKIKKLCPDHPCLSQIGAPPPSGRTVPLPYWMSSLDKFYPEDAPALAGWLKRLAESEKSEHVEMNMSPKLDGVSGVLVLPPRGSGRKANLYSRGNGTVGSDWTKCLPLLHNGSAYTDSGNSAHRTIVRGELIIPRKEFEAHGGEYASSRAMVNGLLCATRNIKPELIRHIHFVAYAVYEPRSLSFTEQWSIMHHLGLEVPFSTETTNTYGPGCVDRLLSDCSKLFRQWRAEAPYDTDGVVIQSTRPCKARCTDGNPSDAFAYKEASTDQSGITSVRGVEWHVSKHGYLKPTVLLDPVQVQGITIKKATGFHAKFIQDNRVGSGATVEITRRGDVIPTIERVVSPATAGVGELPLRGYEWIETAVDIRLSETDMVADPEYVAKRLALSFRIMGVKHASDAAALKLVSAGLCTDFIGAMSLTEASLVGLDGFSTLSAAKLVSEIRRASSTATQAQWIEASHTFCRSIGRMKQKQVLSALPLHEPLPEEDHGRTILANLDGFSTKTVDKVVECLPAVRAFWKAACDALAQTGTAAQATAVHSSPPLDAKAPPAPCSSLCAKTVLLTGFRSDELQKQIEGMDGVKVSSGWSSKVALVVRRDPDYTNQKVKTALASGVPVISRSDCSMETLIALLKTDV